MVTNKHRFSQAPRAGQGDSREELEPSLGVPAPSRQPQWMPSVCSDVGQSKMDLGDVAGQDKVM